LGWTKFHQATLFSSIVLAVRFTEAPMLVHYIITIQYKFIYIYKLYSKTLLSRKQNKLIFYKHYIVINVTQTLIMKSIHICIIVL